MIVYHCVIQTCCHLLPESVLIQTLYNGISVVDDLHQFGHELLFSLALHGRFQVVCSNTKLHQCQICQLVHAVSYTDATPGFSISLRSSCSTLGCSSSRSWVLPLHMNTTHEYRTVNLHSYKQKCWNCSNPTIEKNPLKKIPGSGLWAGSLPKN